MNEKGKNVQTRAKTQISSTRDRELFNAAGVLLQFLVSPEEVGDSICLIRGAMPPGVHVPLHSHAEPEVLYVLDGTLEVYRAVGGKEERRNAWTTVSAGESITIPGHVKHALRNSASRVPSTLLVATKAELYRFFREIAKPTEPRQQPVPLTTAAIRELLAAAEKHGYWMGSPEENAAIGIGQEHVTRIGSLST